MNLDDVSQSTMALIETEYQKLPKFIAPLSGLNDPALDVSSLITSNLISNLNNPRWQTRKEALDFLCNKFSGNKAIISNLGNFYSIIFYRC